MTDIAKHAKLTHAGALKMIEAGIAKALEINVPQCITVTDDGGRLLAFVRMDRAKFLSIQSSHYKAITAVSSGVPTGGVDADVDDGNRPGQTAADAAEARERKKRIRLLEQENEVLRRAAAYLSQANLPGK